ncbi:DUF4279 domain-containing protein [Pelagibius sp. 7325]|uniref:DUF4279 domain-containing protein n=1 Tax=Pelagibius sp. 7325 TaxID=3131994 RepID=UPI0030EBE77A
MTDKTHSFSDDGASREGHPEAPSRFVTVGGLVDRARVSLSIHGDDLIPEEVSKILRVTPTKAHRKGELMVSPTTGPMGTRRADAWILESPCKHSQDPATLTIALLDLLPEDETIWAELAARARIMLRYGLFLADWNRGFTLPPELVTRIARMRASLDIDIYFELEDEPN